MTPVEAAPLAGLAAAMAVIGITLFRMADDKGRAMDDDADSAYGAIRGRVLEPALLSIIESRKGRFKIKGVFRDPDVVMKLEVYKSALFDFNESGSRRGAAFAHMENAYIASFFTAGIVYLALIVDVLAGSLTLFDGLPPVAPAVGWPVAVLGTVAVGYALCRYRAENRAFRLEMRKIRSRLS